MVRPPTRLGAGPPIYKENFMRAPFSDEALMSLSKIMKKKAGLKIKARMDERKKAATGAALAMAAKAKVSPKDSEGQEA